MDNGSDSGAPGSSAGRVVPPKKAASANTKWYAIIAVLIVIIAALAVVGFYKPAPAAGSQTSVVTSAPARAVVGQPYNLTVVTKGDFSSADVYFGDGSMAQVASTGGNSFTVSHIYQWPGTYLVYYTLLTNGTVSTQQANLIPVEAGYSAAQLGLVGYQAYGTLLMNSNINMTTQVSSTNLAGGYNYLSLNPGTTVSFNVSYFTASSYAAAAVIDQSVTAVVNGKTVTENFPSMFVQNTTKPSNSYYLPTGSYLNFSSLSQGFYTVAITSETAVSFNGTTGAPSATVNDTNYVDIAVFNNAKLYTTTVASGTFTNAEVTPGGYTSLDPAISYFTANSEVLDNTLQTLVNYNGSQSGNSPSNYTPGLAALPTTTNGGIYNGPAKNWTETTPWGTTYTESVAPYQNYTFHIRSNATWQNGQQVTAWDVLYSFVRTLLFNNGAPETPGWIQSQYILPGGASTLDYYTSATFYNITHNITVDNATNDITFHFQSPLAPFQVFQAFGSDISGGYITQASWIASQATKAQPALTWSYSPNNAEAPPTTPYTLGWNASGFKAYRAQGVSADYNTNIQNNVFSDGPYMISYILPGQEVVLTANPAYVAPGPWYPAPSIKTVVIQYLDSPATAYYELSTGAADNAVGLPATTYFNSTQALVPSVLNKIVSFNTLSNYFFPFNPDVNTTILSAVAPNENMPFDLFSSLHVRQAFADAFNYTLYIDKFVGNSVFNTTNVNGVALGFGSVYAGMIPKGMIGYQTGSVLKANTSFYPSYNLTIAKADWNYYVNNSNSANSGGGHTKNVTWSASANEFQYNGKPLVIPMFLPSGDTTDQLGMVNWGTNLATIIPGISVEVEFTSYTNIYLDYYGTANPAPLMFAGWAPDYPYPNDYLLPMGLPLNTSTYPGQYNMNLQVFQNMTQNKTAKIYVGPAIGLMDQIANMKTMINEYKASKTTANGLPDLQSMNNMLINMSMYVYTFQNTQMWQMNKAVNINSIEHYQTNVVIGGGQDLLYNLLAFNS